MPPVVGLQAPTPFRSPQDLDAWNVSLFPRDLLQFFKPISPIQLVSHAPTIKDHPTFKIWVSVGHAIVNIKIDPKFKKLLLDVLVASDIIILPSDYPEALIRGNQVIACSVFIRCLEKAGVDTVRVQGYGMKMYVRSPYDGPDLGNPNHPMANLNTFDLGVNYNDGNISLLTNRHDGIPGMQQYTILTPISKGFGGVQMPVHFGGQVYQVKVYPRMVHQIKAQAGNHMLNQPKTVETCMKRRTTLQSHLKQMDKLRASQLGGIRVEATVNSLTLHSAITNVCVTPVLNLEQYINPTIDSMVPYKLRQIMISKQQYLDNLKDMLSKAEEQEVFKGRKTNPAHPDSQQIIVDLFNALGWNTGRFTPTKWNDPGAWWLHSPGAVDVEETNQANQTVQTEAPKINLNRLQGISQLLHFYDHIKEQVSCPVCQNPPIALFNNGGRKQFRLQCKSCKARMNQDQARQYFGQLLEEGRLSVHLASHGLEAITPQAQKKQNMPEQDPDTTEEEDVPMPDVGDSSGDEQASIHPLNGPRRKSNRLSKRHKPAEEPAQVQDDPSSDPAPTYLYGTDPVVVIPYYQEGIHPTVPAQTPVKASSKPATGITEQAAAPMESPQRAIVPEADSVQLARDEREQSVLEELAETVDTALSPPPASLQQVQEEQAEPVEQAQLSQRLPTSQPLLEKPNLKPVMGVTSIAAVLTNWHRLRVSCLVAKDGNCMFRAMSYHIYGNMGLHMHVRKKAIHWLMERPQIVQDFAAQGEGHFSAADYLEKMSGAGVWGDELMLMAIAGAFSVSIMVWSGRNAETGDFLGTVYPHDAAGPHCGLAYLPRSQHYELLFP